MCSATVGATPVKRCTCAASAIFSYGSRGTPGCANTLNRVPELPKAQEGSSMCCRRSTCLTASRSTMDEPAFDKGELDSDGHEVRAEEVGGGPQLRQEVAGAERPVVRDPGGAPGVDPLARVAAEVHPGRGVADAQQWPGHDAPARGDEPVRAVPLLRDPDRGDRPGPDADLDRDAPAA